MNISPHLLIDAIILSAAITITLVLRAKGNAAKKEKESKWLQEKKNKDSKNLNYLKFGIFLIYGSFITIGIFLVYLYSCYIFINKWHACMA